MQVVPSSHHGASAAAANGPPALEELLHSPVRRQIVEMLTPGPTPSAPEAPEMTAAQIAERLGQHVTTARFHLDQLVAGALLESAFRRGRVGRPRKVYRLRHGSVREVTASAEASSAHAALAELLTESFGETEDGRQITPEEAGRRWVHRRAEQLVSDPEDVTPAHTAGEWLGKLGATVDLLERWGYTPELSLTDSGITAELTLRDCPFLALAKDHPDVVCGVHRGLLHGAMEALGEQSTEVSLTPLVTPTTCTASLRRTQAFAPVRSLRPHEENDD